MWTPDIEGLFIAQPIENIDAYKYGEMNNLVHRNYLYIHNPFNRDNNLYKGALCTINLSNVYENKAVTYQELCELYNKLTNQKYFENGHVL